MSRSRIKLRPWMVATLLCVIFIGVVLANNNGDPLTLVTLGTQFTQGIPESAGGTEGYDGQFNYYIARDPSTASAYLDVPAYRFQRILLPALGWLLSFNNDNLIPLIFLIINLIALAAGTALLEHLLVQQGVSRWYALTYGLTLGTLASLRLSLNEPLAYALALGGLVLAVRQRWLVAALTFALAALAKETTFFFVAALAIYLLVNRQWRNAVLFSVIAGLPFTIWQLILYIHLGSFGVGAGGAKATSFEIIPFGGVIRIFTDVPAESRLQVTLVLGAILVPFVLIPTLWALWRGWQAFRNGKRSAYLFLLIVNALIMLFVPFSTYREFLGILRFILGLQIAVILYAAQHHNTRVLRNTTIWIFTSFFLISLIDFP